MRLFFTIITVFIFCFTAFVNGQEKPYAQKEVIGRLAPKVKAYLIDERKVEFRNKNLNQYLFDSLGVKEITRLARGSISNKNEIATEPLLIRFSESIVVDSMIALLEEIGVFEFIEPNYFGNGGGGEICRIAPNDSHYNKQWWARNDGTFNQNSVKDADIDLNHGWTLTTGDSSIVAAILDSGIKPGHPEFEGRIWHNNDEHARNNKDNDSNGYINDTAGWNFVDKNNNIKDDNGHGTNVSGILGANGDNSIGYAGVDWHCKLMMGKILNSNNRGKYSWWISAIYYAIENGADVINMSVGGTKYSLGLKLAVNDAYEQNVPIVTSMMNDNSKTPYYPAAYENSLAVGATDTDNERVDSFSWGGGSNYGDHIDIVAPGNLIYGLSHTSNNDYSNYWSGTSQATPMVTGTITLIKSLNEKLDVDSIEAILFRGAEDQVGKVKEDTKGWDSYHGYGVLNTYRSLVITKSSKVVACSPIKTPSGDSTFTSSGNYWDTLTSDRGCDSVLHISFMMDSLYLNVTNQKELLKAESNGKNIQWVRCDSNYQTIPEATSYTFQPSSSGNYAAIATKGLNCKDTSSCFEFQFSSKNSFKGFGNTVIFPNPNRGNFILKKPTSKKVRVEIVNSNGKTIKEKDLKKRVKRITINQNSGLYYLRIISGSKLISSSRLLIVN